VVVWCAAVVVVQAVVYLCENYGSPSGCNIQKSIHTK